MEPNRAFYVDEWVEEATTDKEAIKVLLAILTTQNQDNEQHKQEETDREDAVLHNLLMDKMEEHVKNNDYNHYGELLRTSQEQEPANHINNNSDVSSNDNVFNGNDDLSSNDNIFNNNNITTTNSGNLANKNS